MMKTASIAQQSRFRAVVCTALVGTAALAGCAIPVKNGAVPETSTVTVHPAPPQEPAPPTTTAEIPAVEPAATVAESLAGIAQALPQGTTVTIFDGNDVHTVGQEMAADGNPNDVAWSTIKVPLAIAALERGVADPTLVQQAITASNNEAATALWNALGGGEAAAAAVAAAIGDVAFVPPQPPRPEFSPFGQTQWQPADQARYAWQLPCVSANSSAAADVYALMHDVIGEQRWGLGMIEGAAFKGGWGPDPSGSYLVRQFGTIPVGDGVVGVALTSHPANGSFAMGTNDLSVAANLLQQALSAVPSVASCATPESAGA